MKTCRTCGGHFSPSNNNRLFCSRRCFLGYPAVVEESRFWSKVDKTATCWLWTAKRNAGGYGQFWAASQRQELAHRTAWRLFHGTNPNGLLVLHECDNPRCVRPEHLFLGTDLDNYHDAARKGRVANRFGKKNGNLKLTDAQVDEIKSRYVPGVTRLVSLAEAYSISTAYVGHLISGRAHRAKQMDPSAALSFGS